MGRRRRSIGPCDDALRGLISWVHTQLDDHELSFVELARDIGYDRSWISRALSGRRMPPLPLIERIATRCGASDETARKLWEAADSIRRKHLAHQTEGYPRPDLDGYPEFCQALRDLVDRRGISQRELVRRDETGLLRRSTVGAVLRMERSTRRDVAVAIVRACGVTDAAVEHWSAAWDDIASPTRQAMERRRRWIATSSVRARSQWWGGAW